MLCSASLSSWRSAGFQPAWRPGWPPSQAGSPPHPLPGRLVPALVFPDERGLARLHLIVKHASRAYPGPAARLPRPGPTGRAESAEPSPWWRASPSSNNARRPLCLMSVRQLPYTMFHATIPISAMLTGPSRVLWGQKYGLMQSRTLAKILLRSIQVGPPFSSRRNPMKFGVFLPNGSNGYIMSKAIPPYMPTWELNRDITLEAERLGFDFSSYP